MTQAQSKSYGGVKKKLVGAVCMLLVASIMMVSSTYAWFTLSTAPEITGISTSVGANGNLEMALLTSGSGDEQPNTFENLDKITSAVGDSVAKTADAKVSNLTWGNLVDLKDASYGLSDIKLMPARLNKGTDNNTVNANNLLLTASYGADGRVTALDGQTVFAVKNGDKGFQYEQAKKTYGVRAIGMTSDLSQRQITFNNAKNAVSAAAGNAGNAFRNAVTGNLSLLVSAAMNETENYTADEIQAMRDVANGAKTTLERITNAYAQAVLAKVASDNANDDGKVEAVKSAVTGIVSAADLSSKLTEANVNNEYTEKLTAIATAQQTVNSVIEKLKGDETTTAALKETAAKPLIGGKADIEAFDKQGQPISFGEGLLKLANAAEVYLNGGVIKAIAAETGNLNLGHPLQTMTAYAGAKNDAAKSGNLSDLSTTVTGLASPAGADSATISDTYGYALDMAFRTNAADSKLLLAGTGVQRVYKDGVNTDTEGKGSTMTFTAGDGMKAEAVQPLMEAIRVAFIDPKVGTIYGIATLENFATSAEDNSTTGTLTLRDYELAADGKLTIKEGTKSAELMTLTQNQATRLTVVVWLDGDTVDNSMVTNGAKSLTGSMNLQFSSSADLVPMENTALKRGTGGAGENVGP